jgi:uncharacterized protein (DUF1697 family)
VRRHVALLRGINNIGASKRIAMADLRALFERLGFRDVRTVLNSGNVVFSSDGRNRRDVLAAIEEGVHAECGVACTVVLLSATEVAAAVRENPFVGASVNPSDLLVVAPRKRSDLERLRPLLKVRWAPEKLARGSRVAYLWCARGVARSPLWATVERVLERSATARNIATMTKLMDAAQAAG